MWLTVQGCPAKLEGLWLVPMSGVVDEWLAIRTHFEQLFLWRHFIAFWRAWVLQQEGGVSKELAYHSQGSLSRIVWEPQVQVCLLFLISARQHVIWLVLDHATLSDEHWFYRRIYSTLLTQPVSPAFVSMFVAVYSRCMPAGFCWSIWSSFHAQPRIDSSTVVTAQLSETVYGSPSETSFGASLRFARSLGDHPSCWLQQETRISLQITQMSSSRCSPASELGQLPRYQGSVSAPLQTCYRIGRQPVFGWVWCNGWRTGCMITAHCRSDSWATCEERLTRTWSRWVEWSWSVALQQQLYRLLRDPTFGCPYSCSGSPTHYK